MDPTNTFRTERNAMYGMYWFSLGFRVDTVDDINPALPTTRNIP